MLRRFIFGLMLASSLAVACSNAPDSIPPTPAGAGGASAGKGGAGAAGKGGEGGAGKGGGGGAAGSDDDAGVDADGGDK